MPDTQWWLYVQQLIGDDTAQDAAAKAGFDKSAFTRWKNGARADASMVVKLARAYGGSVLDGLVASEVISRAEANQPSGGKRLVEYSDADLLRELSRRANDREFDLDSPSGSRRAREALEHFGYSVEWQRVNWKIEAGLIRALARAYAEGIRDVDVVTRIVDRARDGHRLLSSQAAQWDSDDPIPDFEEYLLSELRGGEGAGAAKSATRTGSHPRAVRTPTQVVGKRRPGGRRDR